MAGGVLVVSSGFIEHGIIAEIIFYLGQHTSQLISGSASLVVQALMSILSFLIGLGGITIILGGIIILRNHITVGRLLIGLGGGVGMFGFIITFGYSLVIHGPVSIITHAYYWVGLLCSLIGAQLAKH
jgi:hypothetical protein